MLTFFFLPSGPQVFLRYSICINAITAQKSHCKIKIFQQIVDLILYLGNLGILRIRLTVLVELLCAFAPLRQPHDGHHLGAQAGAPLLVARQGRGVRAPAAGAFLQTVHGPRDAGGAHHVTSRHAQPAHPTRAGHLHRTAQHHGPAGLEGQEVGAGLKKKKKKRKLKCLR